MLKYLYVMLCAKTLVSITEDYKYAEMGEQKWLL